MKFRILFYLAVLCAHLPMLLKYSLNMWNKGHYQFFPLLLVIVGWLAYDRLSQFKVQTDATSKKVAIGLWIANLLVLSLSALLYSTFLAMPAVVIGLAAYVVDRYGLSGFRCVLPIWLLLFLIIPLPGDLDTSLIQALQFAASQLASWMLDGIGQNHFLEGVTLITEKEQFFTQEACSGIRSLFSSLAAVSIYGIIRRYPLWRHLINLTQTVLWVVTGNALRIAIVVYVADNWTNAIASGTNHEMLGLGVFWFIVLMALCTDRGIDTFSNPDLTLDKLPIPATGHSGTNAEGTMVSKTPRPTPFHWALLSMFVIVFVFSARLNFVLLAPTILNHRPVLSMDVKTETQQSDLPASIGGWKVVAFDKIVRDESSLEAPESYVWTLKDGNREIVVSLDSPYTSFHELGQCYNGLGWNGISRHEYQTNESGQRDGYSRLTINKPDRTGVVYFSAYTRTGELIIPPAKFSVASRMANIRENINLAFGIDSGIADYSLTVPVSMLPVSQIQVFCEQLDQWSEAETEEVKQIFLEVRQILVKTARFTNERFASGT